MGYENNNKSNKESNDVHSNIKQGTKNLSGLSSLNSLSSLR